MIPDFNNVYGHVVAPHSLEAVLRAVRPLAAGGQAWIKVSGYDGAPTLHLETDSLDFQTTPLGEGRHLFNGGVGGTAGEVIALVENLSRALSAAGVEHAFEVYDEDQNLLRLVPAVPGAMSP